MLAQLGFTLAGSKVYTTGNELPLNGPTSTRNNVLLLLLLSKRDRTLENRNGITYKVMADSTDTEQTARPRTTRSEFAPD